jgi:hypothetical protein
MNPKDCDEISDDSEVDQEVVELESLTSSLIMVLNQSKASSVVGMTALLNIWMSRLIQKNVSKKDVLKHVSDCYDRLYKYRPNDAIKE